MASNLSFIDTVKTSFHRPTRPAGEDTHRDGSFLNTNRIFAHFSTHATCLLMLTLNRVCTCSPANRHRFTDNANLLTAFSGCQGNYTHGVDLHDTTQVSFAVALTGLCMSLHKGEFCWITWQTVTGVVLLYKEDDIWFRLRTESSLTRR